MRCKFLIFFLLSHSLAFAQPSFTGDCKNCSWIKGGIVRDDSTVRKAHLVFTGDEFGEGMRTITRTLKKHQIRGSFFFTGRFFRNPQFSKSIKKLKKHGHYLGPHSDAHLLYCDWTNRDSLLVTKEMFREDMIRNLQAMDLSFPLQEKRYYIPSYEWWNDSIAIWSNEMNLQVISFTPGVRTNADYTYPEMSSYKSTEWILGSLRAMLEKNPNALNGAIILVHVGTDPRRKDKLFNRLDELIGILKSQGIGFYQPG